MQFIMTFGLEWLELAFRWTHIIVGIAWIGSSFYFIALDLGLRKGENLNKKAHGEQWQVHGGGFYHIQKYLVSPDKLPDRLIWFKWESYSTWLTGFALLIVTYYFSADTLLIDPYKNGLFAWQAILISLASIGLGWVVYNTICKSKFGDDNTRLMILLYIILVAMAWGYTQVFSDRAAFLHLGAFTATIMSANVFFIIIPNQKIVVDDLKAGRTPDAKYGKIAKQRSTHNNYLTLPVIFFMMSNHYPLAFGTEYNWIIAALIFLMGVTIRHFFNTQHGQDKLLWWTWGATAVLFITIILLSTQTGKLNLTNDEETASFTPNQQILLDHESYEDVKTTMLGRCSMCHAAEPFYSERTLWAPNGAKLDTDIGIVRHAKDIYLHAGLTRSMPPANVSFMEDSERKLIIDWYEESMAK